MKTESQNKILETLLIKDSNITYFNEFCRVNYNSTNKELNILLYTIKRCLKDVYKERYVGLNKNIINDIYSYIVRNFGIRVATEKKNILNSF